MDLEMSSLTLESNSKNNNRYALFFIFTVVFVNSLGASMVMPVLPSFITNLTGGTIGQAASWGGILTGMYAVIMFLAGPAVGNLSDKHGRRPVILLSLGLLVLDYIIMALAPDLFWLFAGRILSGFSAATFAVSSAFIADVSEKQDRAANFGLIGAGFGLGFVIGPAIGGLIVELGLRAPFYAAAIINAASLLYGVAVLPETLGMDKRRSFTWKCANPFMALKPLAVPGKQRPLLLALLFYMLAQNVYPAVWAYFTEGTLGWKPAQIGISLAFYGFSYTFVQGYLTRVLSRKLGLNTTLALGMLSGIIALGILAITSQTWLAFAVIPIAALGALSSPAFNGILANRTSDNAQGDLQGIVAALAGISLIFSPLVMTQVYHVFTTPQTLIQFPGAPFALAAALLIAAILLVAKDLHQ
ncbi:MFS transporter [Roseibium sp. RKSG952]|uniref:MFS transporter n=1 Tax=Roseibium sp. RKSG952 TaxID=2529384 RepID=UPI0012BC81D5|nr:MFS transporter [Roseibium sp. RKSG952]MTH95129.1 MFS transporter [Roseibium sp. RKSG952]